MSVFIPRLSRPITCPCGRFLGELGWFADLPNGERLVQCNRALMPTVDKDVKSSLGCQRYVLFDGQGEVVDAALYGTHKYNLWRSAIARYNAGNPKAVEELTKSPIADIRRIHLSKKTA